ncbi:DUF5808 domain-containing protein [Kitasatospora sp. NPDC002227]|uniref:DUF1648 domain-containing protein n=1 Tax=Kitasatospora sp. NPDC002227 TaxID=3154773 RepID=UPI003318D4D7
MNAATVVAGVLVPGFVLALGWVMPSLTAPDLPFGARVPAARQGEPVIAEQRRSYRRWLGASGAVVLVGGAVLTALAGGGRGGGAAVALLLPALAALAVILVGYVRARRAVLAAKEAGHWYRGLRQGVAADTSLRSGPPGVTWLWALPALLLTAGTAAVGAVRYDGMPEQLATHFDAGGAVDHFTAKTPLSAFAPVIGQLAVTVLMLLVVWAVSRGRADLDPARPAASAARHRRYVARLGAALLVLTASVDLTMLLAALKIWSGATTLSPVPVLAPLVFGFAVLVLVALRTGQGGARLAVQEEPDSGLVHADDDRHWRLGGMVYLNHEDPALLVPKRFGIGWTVNYGNPLALIVTVLATGLAVVLAVRS